MQETVYSQLFFSRNSDNLLEPFTAITARELLKFLIRQYSGESLHRATENDQTSIK